RPSEHNCGCCPTPTRWPRSTPLPRWSATQGRKTPGSTAPRLQTPPAAARTPSPCRAPTRLSRYRPQPTPTPPSSTHLLVVTRPVRPVRERDFVPRLIQHPVIHPLSLPHHLQRVLRILRIHRRRGLQIRHHLQRDALLAGDPMDAHPRTLTPMPVHRLNHLQRVRVRGFF